MANGYLGKISAVVTANTADFQAKLDSAASDVRKFSREVQSNITKAMGDAEKSIQSIYTPLQRLEGSLRAAGSLKLNFKGFAGAIKDVEDLKGRLGSLNNQQLSIVLNESGLGKLREVRSALREISNRDVRLFDAAGGMRELQKLQATLDTARGQKKLAQLGIDESELDALIQKFKRFPRQRIEAVINVLGKDMLDSAFTRTQQMVSVVEQINKPLAAAVLQFEQLSSEVQANFIPALNRVQQPAQNLADSIKRGCKIGQDEFNALSDRVRSVTVSIKQLSEAAALVGNIKTGRELAFDQPGLNAALTRAGSFGSTAMEQMATTPSTRANSDAISSVLQQITVKSNEAIAILASLKDATLGGRKFIADSLQADLDRTVADIDRLVAEGSKNIEIKADTAPAKVAVDQLAVQLKQLQQLATFTVTGNFQNSQQTTAAIQEIIGMMGKLDAAQKSALSFDLDSLIAAATPNSAGVVDLDTFKMVYESLKAEIDAGLKVNLDKDAAEKKLKDFGARVRELVEDANFSLTGRVQNSGQAEGEIKRVVAGLDKLDAAGRAAVRPLLVDAIKSLSAEEPNIDAIRVSVKALTDEFSRQKSGGSSPSVDTSKAQAKIDALRAAWAKAFTGKPQDIESVDQQLNGIFEKVGKLDDASRQRLSGIIEKFILLRTQVDAGKAPLQTLIDLVDRLGDSVDNIGAADKLVQKLDKLSANPTTAALRAEAEDAKRKGIKPSDSLVGRVDGAAAFGRDVNDPLRQVDLLKSRIVALNTEVAGLSSPLRTKLSPELQKLRTEWDYLANRGVAVTAEEVERVAKKVGDVESRSKRASAAMQFSVRFDVSGLERMLDSRVIRGYEAQLELLAGVVSKLSGKAGIEGRAAMLRFALAVQKALDAGTTGDPKVAKDLRKVGQEAAAAIAKLNGSGVTVGSLQGQLKRAGDVGRGGVDKLSLALNQAAFAVDDFMSSTGGMEFKLRAISNNITQLAFVVGGTAGLWVGLGAVIAGQATIGIIKWLNNGRSAEDQTKALNDALSRQKSLVEELAQAFGSLGDSINRGLLSPASESATEFNKQLDDVKKKQKALREEQVAGLDDRVQQERAEQVKLKSELEKSTNASERVGLQRRINSSVERERQAAEAAVNRDVAPDEARNAIREALQGVRLAGLDPRGNDIRTFEAKAQEIILQSQKDSEAVPVGVTAEDRLSQREALDKEIKQLAEKAKDAGRFFFPDDSANAARDAILPLQRVLESIDLPVIKAIGEAANEIALASRAPADQIRRAQSEVAEAIKLGLPGARLFQLELDNNAAELEKATKKLKFAQTGKDENDRPIDRPTRLRLAAEAESQAAALNRQRAEISARADEFLYQRVVDPQNQMEARASRASSNLNDAGVGEGLLARRLREIDAIRQRISQQELLSENNNPVMRGFFSGQEAALNKEVAAIEAATAAIKIFSDVLNRASEEARGNLNSAQQRADEARRADLGNSTPQTQEARRQAEADLERQREIERAAQTEIAVERDRLEQKAASPEATRMQEIDEELRSGRTKADETRERLASEVDRAARTNELAQARERVINDTFRAAEDLGIDTDAPGMNARVAKDAIRAKGRGDVADELDRRNDESIAAMQAAGFSWGESTTDVWSTIEKAGEELAAALARQAEAASGGDRESLIREREALKARMDDDARTGQDRINAARDASTREAEQAKAAEKGRELTKTPEQRFREETDAGMEAIRQYYGRKAEDEGGLIDFAGQRAAEERFMKDREKEARSATPEGRGAELGMTQIEKFRRDMNETVVKDVTARAREMQGKGESPSPLLRQAIQNQMESVAPALQQLNEARTNAELQGPSRAALNVSDVSTTQGQSELNRLLRGDDSAKDVNLVELQKQTQKFDELIDAIRQANPGVLL